MELERITPHNSLANGFLEEKERECVEPINEEEEQGCVGLLRNLEFARWVVLESGSAVDKWREETVDTEAVVSMVLLRLGEQENRGKKEGKRVPSASLLIPFIF